MEAKLCRSAFSWREGLVGTLLSVSSSVKLVRLLVRERPLTTLGDAIATMRCDGGMTGEPGSSLSFWILYR